MSYVRLIGVTQPVIDEVYTANELLAFCARVSSSANQLNHSTGPKLIASLIKRKEWSPLEMVSATMEIHTTRDIGRQILRHRSFSFQEFSQRYSKIDEEFVLRPARMQDQTDRQNSFVIDATEVGSDAWKMKEDWSTIQAVLGNHINEAYNWALNKGIAKEVARAVLPEGMTPTKMYMAGTLRSWVHYTGLRCDPKTQLEHREVAYACLDQLVGAFPVLDELRETLKAPGASPPIG